MKKNALIIMAKEPDAGSVKTRLSGHMTDKKRLEIYTFLLENTIGKLKSIEGIDAFIAYAPETGRNYFARFNLGIFPQSNGDIGERMHSALSSVLKHGYQKSVLAGVDIPDISASIILKAFDLLEGHEIVFGPASDGGFYLVGLKSPVSEIFHDIPWSTNQTLKKCIEITEKLGLSTAFTETLSDIDTFEDVKRADLLQ